MYAILARLGGANADFSFQGSMRIQLALAIDATALQHLRPTQLTPQNGPL